MIVGYALIGIVVGAPGAGAQTVEIQNDSVALRLVDTDLRTAIQAIGRYLPKPVLTGPIGEVRVEIFETPAPVPRAQLPELLRGLVEANGLTFAEDSAFYRISRPAPLVGPGAQARASQQPQEQVTFQLFTVRLKHARAADVAATLNQLYGAGGDFSRPAGLSSGRLSDELRSNRQIQTPDGAAQAPPPQPVGATLRSSTSIVPDELTNSLLIRATQADYDVLQQAIDQLDVRPLQVLIEAVVVEARKDRKFALGFDVEVPPTDVGDGTVEGSLFGAGLGDLVVRVMGMSRASINATLALARERGDVEILSRPILLASNNTEASLLVGTQQPFVQVSRSLPTDTPQRDQVVQYLDVGTKLTILPTINEDGYVSLQVQQEISAATGETQFSAPVISSRETSTQVLVADGQTIVIGGLRDEVHDRVKSGIPLLVDIPVIGGLFGGTHVGTTETELFLFLTPTIISNDADADAATFERVPDRLRERELDHFNVCDPNVEQCRQ